MNWNPEGKLLATAGRDTVTSQLSYLSFGMAQKESKY